MPLTGSLVRTAPAQADAFVFPFGVSVFFPAYNDAPSLPRLLERTFEVLRRHVADYEVIVINDGSQDDTAIVLEQLRSKYAPYLRVVTHEQNRGYGGALRSGFASATKEFIFYTDGDGQYDPGELVLLLRQVTPDVGLVNGYKRVRSDPWRRVAIGWLYNKFARFLFAVKLRDIDCDFRLIRKSLLDGVELTSTSGTICVELVRKLELAAKEVVEVPVSHYPRMHGASQFFRVRSLATTFVQLWKLFWRIVVLKMFSAGRPAALPVMALIALLSILAYGRALTLPFISDDYVQIELGRRYGPVSGWSSLAADALYRCRATSILLTHWTEQIFGIESIAFSVSSLLLHILNSWLVFGLGVWRLVGWRASAVAACFFAFCQQHQEAVIWYAALPELLVFFFSLASFVLWVRWLQSPERSWKLYAGSLACFTLALLSKESAVAMIPLMTLAAVIEGRAWKRLLPVLPVAAMGAAYFLMAFAARGTHLHFNDGTFSLSAPFWSVIGRSTVRLFWFWGLIGLIALAYCRAWEWKRTLAAAGAWIAITLLPYSFLTYMPYVPSRHTYFATVGLALVIGAAFLALSDRDSRHARFAGALAAILVIHHTAYIWTKKHAQFAERAAPTERLLQLAEKAEGPIYIRCFPYAQEVAELAVEFRSGNPVPLVFARSEGAAHGVDLCAEPETPQAIAERRSSSGRIP